MQPKLSFVYAVATSCLRSPAPAVTSSLGAICDTAPAHSFSALIMCYDVAQRDSSGGLGNSSSIISKKKKQGRIEEPVEDPEPDSFLAMFRRASGTAARENFNELYPGLPVTVTAAPNHVTKLFRSDPRAAPILRASKVGLCFKHF